MLTKQKEKAKQELNRLIKPHSHGGFICSHCISPLEFSVLLSFSFKTIANSNREIRCPYADAANKFVRLISVINSYLAFSFFSFFFDNVFAIRCMYFKWCNSYPFIQLKPEKYPPQDIQPVIGIFINGNRTEWSPIIIQSVIIRVILKQNQTTAQRESNLFNHEYDYRLNWTI